MDYETIISFLGVSILCSEGLFLKRKIPGLSKQNYVWGF